MSARRHPNDEGDNPVSEESKLTEAFTALVTRARIKTKAAHAREHPELPRGKAVSLLVTDGPLKGHSFPIEKPQVVIGRVEGDIVISDAQISRIHCVVEVHGLTGLLVDLESGNGTVFNGKKITSCEIDHMSEFRIGKTTLMYVLTG